MRVLLSCKHKVIAEGIAAVLRTQPDLEVVSLSDHEAQTRTLLERTHPDVVVMGVDAQAASDVELARWMSLQTPRPEVVVFSTDCDKAAVVQMMQAGVGSFVSTRCSMDELLQAIRAAGAGRTYLCPSASALMVDSWGRSGNRQAPHGRLGEREEQVLCLIADGYTSKEIARNLRIAPSTVEVHRRNIMRKVGLHKVADLTRYAIRHQMVQV